MATEIKTTRHRSHVRHGALLGPPIKHPLRALPVLAVVVAGAAHIPVIPAHLREAPYIGVLFIVLTVASFALAAVLALGDVAAAYLSTAAVMGLALLAYVISRTVGLPQIGDDIGNWLGNPLAWWRSQPRQPHWSAPWPSDSKPGTGAAHIDTTRDSCGTPAVTNGTVHVHGGDASMSADSLAGPKKQKHLAAN